MSEYIFTRKQLFKQYKKSLRLLIKSYWELKKQGDSKLTEELERYFDD